LLYEKSTKVFGIDPIRNAMTDVGLIKHFIMMAPSGEFVEINYFLSTFTRWRL